MKQVPYECNGICLIKYRIIYHNLGCIFIVWTIVNPSVLSTEGSISTLTHCIYCSCIHTVFLSKEGTFQPVLSNTSTFNQVLYLLGCFHFVFNFYFTTIQREILCVYLTTFTLVFVQYNELINEDVLLWIKTLSVHKVVKIGSILTSCAVSVPHHTARHSNFIVYFYLIYWNFS